MSTAITESFDRSVEGPVVPGGFRVQLYTVAAGAYVGDASYGVSAAAAETYSSDITTGQGRFQRTGKVATFNVELTLDTSGADPITTGTGELRIRVLPAAGSEPGRYSRGLPRGVTNDSFVSVEVVDTTTGQTPAGYATAGVLSTRLLDDGSLALVVTPDVTAAPPAPVALTAAAVTPSFGGTATNFTIRVNGTYMSS